MKKKERTRFKKMSSELVSRENRFCERKGKMGRIAGERVCERKIERERENGSASGRRSVIFAFMDETDLALYLFLISLKFAVLQPVQMRA